MPLTKELAKLFDNLFQRKFWPQNQAQREQRLLGNQNLCTYFAANTSRAGSFESRYFVPLLTCLAQPGGLFSIEEEIRSTKVKIVSPGPDQKYAKKEEERKFPSLSKKLVVRYQIGKHNTRRREGYATPIFRKSCVQSPSADHQLHCNTLQCSVQCCSWKTSRLGFSSSALTILSTKMQNFSGIACIPVICHFW